MYQFTCNHLGDFVTNIPLSTILNSKAKPQCVDCGCPGPNLWVCLHKNCHHVGCSDKSNDHNTQHNIANPSHCIHINIHTKRIWCYECKNEIFLVQNNDSEPECDSSKANYIRLHPSSEQQIGFDRNIGMSGDISESSDGDDCSEYSMKPVGLVGLQNIGNTCYMNAALQALSNTVPLSRFFLECAPTVQILSDGKKPGLSRTFQALMMDIWVKKNGGYVSPSGILYGIRNVYPMFRGYYQHDTQEFLRNFMDQLHEELKQIAPPDQSHTSDSDTFSLATDEPTLSSNYDSSEGEYETCDSGVSERSSLSDDTEKTSSSSNKRRLSRSVSPSRRMRTRFHSVTVVDTQSACLNSPSVPVPSTTTTTTATTNSTNKKQMKFRSIISDIFDGKLLSSVQCLTCDRVSSRIETFQDLSLPIPSRDHLVLLHGRNTNVQNSPTASNSTLASKAVIPANDGWMAWILAWIKSWFYGPTVTLHDCLAAFFSTDELKGDNMYSCEKCNKLRNGIKFNKVLQLPEVLCIHLKRFRHELMFSSKISSSVSFPLKGLDMEPYLHADYVSKVTTYDLYSIICHYGTAGGGHYICYVLNGGQWYEFDDQYVTKVTPEKVQSCEAYVLFYRKVTDYADGVRQKAAKLWRTHSEWPELTFVSKQWLNLFNTCAEPSPIDNSDVLCQHGLINPEREINFNQLTVCLPLPVYEYLYKKFGGCPPLTAVHICPACQALNKRLLNEMETFAKTVHLDTPRTHLISVNWYNQWQKFMQKRITEPPGPVDNSKINIQNIDPNECFEVSEDVWKFFHGIYGGGPEIRIRQDVIPLQRSESESSVGSEECNETGKETKFVIPNLKKEKIDVVNKAIYSSGEPMETERVEVEHLEGECNGIAEEVDYNKNGNSEVEDEDIKKSMANNVRYRRRRLALSNNSVKKSCIL